MRPNTLAVIAVLTLAAPAIAQPPPAPRLPQASPASKVEQNVGVGNFVVAYSSPGVKGRTVFGELVPYGETWRTGANAATTIEADQDFTFGGKPIPAGKYSLYTIPTKTTWTVALNKNPTAGGVRGYDAKDDVARITVTPSEAPKRERLTFLFAETTDDGTRLDLEWDTVRVSVPITVDTAKLTKTNIDKALDEAWRPHFASARYLLDSGGDLGQALGYVDTSIAIKPTWWNNWVRAQILAKQGKKADAIAAAEKAQTLGKGDDIYQQFFQSQVATAIADWKK